MPDLMKRTDFTPGHKAQMRQAATLVMVRDAAPGVEVFMMKRPTDMDFGGLYVFPGGKVDEDDRRPELFHVTDGYDAQLTARRMGDPEDAAAYWFAALRECFEECGVLLARESDGSLLRRDAHEDEQLIALRVALREQRCSLLDICADLEVRLAIDQVHYFSHWITPEGPPRRYDTRFFLTQAPPEQAGKHDHEELVDSVWLTPESALAAYEEGRLLMIYPTITTLRSLCGFSDVASLIAQVEGGRHLPAYSDELQKEGMQPFGGML